MVALAELGLRAAGDGGAKLEHVYGALRGGDEEGMALGDGIGKLHGHCHDALDGGNAAVMDRGRAVAEGTGERENRDAGVLAAARDFRGDLAARGLEVNGALGGDDDVRPREQLIQLLIEQDLEAVARLRAEGHEPRAQASQYPRARPRHNLRRWLEMVVEQSGEVLQACFKLLDLLGSRLLLRAEDTGDAALTGEHVEDIAGEDDIDVVQARVQLVGVKTACVAEVCAAGCEFVSVFVLGCHAQRGERAGAAVRGARVPAADDDGLNIAVEEVAEELAHAVGGGRAGVAQVLRHEGEACAGGHLDDGEASRGELDPLGGDLLSDGSGDF